MTALKTSGAQKFGALWVSPTTGALAPMAQARAGGSDSGRSTADGIMGISDLKTPGSLEKLSLRASRHVLFAIFKRLRVDTQRKKLPTRDAIKRSRSAAVRRAGAFLVFAIPETAAVGIVGTRPTLTASATAPTVAIALVRARSATAGLASSVAAVRAVGAATIRHRLELYFEGHQRPRLRGRLGRRLVETRTDTDNERNTSDEIDLLHSDHPWTRRNASRLEETLNLCKEI